MVPILLWIPAFYKSLEYIIDSDSVKIRKGVFWRKRVAVPYQKITNVDITQGPVQRMFNIGTIHVQTAGAGGLVNGRVKVYHFRSCKSLPFSVV
ncbi:MAG: PH domain-containing protein [Candidatus Binatia bacterium]